jgi:hypothetical protein
MERMHDVPGEWPDNPVWVDGPPSTEEPWVLEYRRRIAYCRRVFETKHDALVAAVLGEDASEMYAEAVTGPDGFELRGEDFRAALGPVFEYLFHDAAKPA